MEALKYLQGRGLRLVILSNVDRESFSKTNEGALQGFKFDAIYTAEDIGSYKPDPKNFEYLLRKVKEEFGIEKERVLMTAQSLFHDHQPANKIGLSSAWIARKGGVMGVASEHQANYDFKYATLGDMAEAFKKEMEQ